MPSLPHQPRDIVRVLASVDRTLHTFFYDNSNLSTAYRITKKNGLSSPVPPPGHIRPKGIPVRPGVVLDVSPDYATVAMFTTLKGKALSEIKGLLRPVVAAILPVNHKHDPAALGGLHALAVHPTWRIPGAAKHSLCLCLKHRIPINEVKPWNWKGEPAVVGEKPRMCKADFRLLQHLCERNERLRGLFVSEIRWLFEELSLEDLAKRYE